MTFASDVLAIRHCCMRLGQLLTHANGSSLLCPA
ncbi:hypothetical protein A2U01_0094161, partial [Trifolium medium]|nr:hypothetical protein [Trifolium medium]